MIFPYRGFKVELCLTRWLHFRGFVVSFSPQACVLCMCVCVLGALTMWTSACVSQVCLCVHVCVQPMAVRGPQSNLTLWSPWPLEASASPHLILQFSSLAQGPGPNISLSALVQPYSPGILFSPLGLKGWLGCWARATHMHREDPAVELLFFFFYFIGPHETCSQPQTSWVLPKGHETLTPGCCLKLSVV